MAAAAAGRDTRTAMTDQLRGRFREWARARQPGALPVRFDRGNIYVLPTPFGCFFLALLGAMAIGALNYNNNPALLLGLLLAGAANTSLFAAHLQLSGMEVTAVGAEPVPAGSVLSLRVHVRAPHGRARRGLRIHCGSVEAGLSLHAGAGVGELAIPTRERGWLDPERLRISTTRPLGLARAWAYAWPELPVLVYPAPEAQGPPLPTGSGDHASARLHASGEEVHHLRAYRRGDARSAIAWKPSARRDQLLVREFERPVGADIVLDWHALAGLGHEARISRLARWVDEAERDGRRYALHVPGWPPIGPASGSAQRHACLKALALMPRAQR